MYLHLLLLFFRIVNFERLDTSTDKLPKIVPESTDTRTFPPENVNHELHSSRIALGSRYNVSQFIVAFALTDNIDE